MTTVLPDLAHPVWKVLETSNRQMLIGGELVDAHSGELMDVESPGYGSSLGSVPAAGPVDVAMAVAAARDASGAWRDTDVLSRRQCIRALAEAVASDADLYGAIDAVDSGNPLNSMRADAAA